MKKMMIAFVSTLLLSTVSFAETANNVDFSKIKLEGVQILDQNNEDSLQRNVKLLKNPTQDLVKSLESATYSTIVSPVFESGPSAGFRNVYVFIGKNDDGVFSFTYVLVNRSSGSMFPINMAIVDVQKDHLDVVHGSSDSLRKYKVVSGNGPLF
jgi:hypothetical protein